MFRYKDGDVADKQQEEGYIVEFITIGKTMKVSAIDPVSLREVSMVASPRFSRKYLTKLAVRKLKYVLEKEKTPDV